MARCAIRAALFVIIIVVVVVVIISVIVDVDSDDNMIMYRVCIERLVSGWFAIGTNAILFRLEQKRCCYSADQW